MALLQNGSIETTRYNPKWGYKRDDNSLFGLISGLFIFKTFYVDLPIEQQVLINEITEVVKKISLSYKNKKNSTTYNFYPSIPNKHFGNGFLLHRMKHFKLPDDIDDTALVYLCFPPTRDKINDVNDLLINHRHSKYVYNTWFAENMDEETDVCAMINMLVCMHKNNIWGELEENSLNYVLDSFIDLPKKAFSLSRHYGHPALLLYHYGRLLEHIDLPKVQKIKPALINEVQKIMATKIDQGFKLLCASTLNKLGETSSGNHSYDFKDFYTFIGAPWAPILGINRFTASKWSIIYWKSDFHNLALYLEYLTFKKKYYGS